MTDFRIPDFSVPLGSGQQDERRLDEQFHADPDRLLGEVFRRLSLMRAELGEYAFARAVQAVLAALGGAALEEAERRARTLRDRTTLSSADVRVTAAAARPFDADRWDPGDPD